jgi:trehalose utilization protein
MDRESMDKQALRVAVVTGGHTFDVIGFHRLFREIADCDAYIQALEDWSAGSRAGVKYDVVVFYSMHTSLPENAPGGSSTRAAIDGLGDGTGIVVLHHALLAFKQDTVWDTITGMTDRTIAAWSHDEQLQMQVTDRNHPITTGIDDFSITDETYDFCDVEGDDSHVLLRANHPGSMSTLAWTRSHGESRVLNLVLGHDDQAWSNSTFRTLLRQGIHWCAHSVG